jgi:hypothetical protein
MFVVFKHALIEPIGSVCKLTTSIIHSSLISLISFVKEVRYLDNNFDFTQCL